MHGAAQAEKQLSELVVAKAVEAKIDRPAGLIVFGLKPKPEQVLAHWFCPEHK